MFEELWLIKNSLCYYYKSWCDNPIKIDTDLFSGFFTAFNSFQEEVFPEQFVNYIDFIDSRLLFLKFNDLFIIVRDIMQKPLTRSLLQLNNLSIEIISRVESIEDLKSFLLSDKPSSVASGELVTEKLNEVVNDAIQILASADNQMNKFDIMAMIIILRELNLCVLHVAETSIFNEFQAGNMSWLYHLTISDEPINPETFTVESYNIIVAYVQAYLDYLSKNMQFHIKKVNETEQLVFLKELNRFLAVNREVLTKFGLTDLYISKFLGNLKI